MTSARPTDTPTTMPMIAPVLTTDLDGSVTTAGACTIAAVVPGWYAVANAPLLTLVWMLEMTLFVWREKRFEIKGTTDSDQLERGVSHGGEPRTVSNSILVVVSVSE